VGTTISWKADSAEDAECRTSTREVKGKPAMARFFASLPARAGARQDDRFL
jgi:hypothetical protein